MHVFLIIPGVAHPSRFGLVQAIIVLQIEIVAPRDLGQGGMSGVFSMAITIGGAIAIRSGWGRHEKGMTAVSSPVMTEKEERKSQWTEERRGEGSRGRHIS